MKKNIINWILLLALVSCTKEQGVPGPAGPQGPAGTNGKGSADTAAITGKLIVYNEFNAQTDLSGVTVTLSSGSNQHSATTDATGQYTFKGMPTGTYDLSFQKTSYGTMKLFGLSHFAGGTMPTQATTVFLLQMPVKTAPETLTLVSNNSSSAVLDLRLDTTSLQYTELSADILVCIGKNRIASPYDYDFLLNTYIFPDGNGGYTANVYKSQAPIPLTTGDTLYATAFTYNRNVGTANGASQSWSDLGLSSYYMDPLTGKYVYPNLSKASNIVKFAY